MKLTYREAAREHTVRADEELVLRDVDAIDSAWYFSHGLGLVDFSSIFDNPFLLSFLAGTVV